MTEVPGLRPRSPVSTVGPVLVTVDAPSTAKFCAVPNGGAICARRDVNDPMETNKTTLIEHDE